MTKRMDNKSLLDKVVMLLDKNELSTDENRILIQAKTALEEGAYFNKVVCVMKNELLLLAVQNKLSKEVLDLFTEISRQNPTTGAASIGNVFIQ